MWEHAAGVTGLGFEYMRTRKLGESELRMRLVKGCSDDSCHLKMNNNMYT